MTTLSERIARHDRPAPTLTVTPTCRKCGETADLRTHRCPPEWVLRARNRELTAKELS